MKKSLTGLVVLLAGAFSAHCQGTISFSNYAYLGNYIEVSLLNYSHSPPYTIFATVLGGSSTVTTGNPAHDTANGDDWTVALYGAAGANVSEYSLQPLIDITTGGPLQAQLEDGTTDSVLGTWYSDGIGKVPGAFAEQYATVQIRAWYNDGGVITSYAQALADGFSIGFSPTANVILGGPFDVNNRPPVAPAQLPSFQYFSGFGGSLTVYSVPEANTIALAVLGGAVFLRRLRMK